MIKKYSPDLIFICTVIFLIGFGTLVMYSAGAFTAAMKFENYAHYLMKHIQWITIGTILYFLCSRFKYKNIKYMIPWIVSLTWIIILLAFLLNPTNRPSRWLIIDGGSFTVDGSADPHVFYAGKLYRDSKGALTFVNIFTLVFE